jgi:hypothetical protein
MYVRRFICTSNYCIPVYTYTYCCSSVAALLQICCTCIHIHTVYILLQLCFTCIPVYTYTYCIHTVAPLLQLCCTCIPVYTYVCTYILLQLCCTSVARVSPCIHIHTVLYTYCRSSVAPLLHLCCTCIHIYTVYILLHLCCSSVAALLHVYPRVYIRMYIHTCICIRVYTYLHTYMRCNRGATVCTYIHA